MGNGEAAEPDFGLGGNRLSPEQEQAVVFHKSVEVDGKRIQLSIRFASLTEAGDFLTAFDDLDGGAI